ncbi:DUF2971 domain-containing protein, partial [Aeromonas hydrophila]|uniref:DUF2971 domain-containing protein n=1 Tax=Aeromonas hydrophila TaxID=644 RepID=UPI000A54BF03
ARARELLEQAVQADNADAMLNLGNMYRDGQGVPQDLTRARELFEQAVQADHPGAMVNLGNMYVNKQGVPQNATYTRELYEKATQAGNAIAMANLGLMYIKGQGVPLNLVRARELYEKAVQAGHVQSMFILGDMYFEGQGGPKNIKNARSMWEKAACAGEPTGWVLLISLDYINDESNAIKIDKENINDINSNANSEDFLSLWNDWVNDQESMSKPLPPSPLWLDLYIESVMLKHNPSAFNENKEFWRIIAIVKLLSQWQQAQHLVTDNTTIHHFTKFEVIEKLIPDPYLSKNFTDKNILRCYHVSYMNDPSEGLRLLRYGSKEKSNKKNVELEASKGARLLNKWFNESSPGSYFNQLDNAVTVANMPASVFTVSFTERADSLDLWRAYGNDGKGVSIGFPIQGVKNLYFKSPSIMEKESSHSNGDMAEEGTTSSATPPSRSNDMNVETRFYRVEYSDAAVANALALFAPPLSRLDYLIKNIGGEQAKWKSIASKHITEALLHILYLFKDESYASEKEVRAIEIHYLDSAKVLRDERSPRRLYCELPGCSLFTKAKTQVIIGPKAEDANAMIWDIRHLLTQHKYSWNVSVKRSDVKYR